MTGILLAYSILLNVGLMSKSDYSNHIDSLFIENPNNDLILELQWAFSNAQKCLSMCLDYCNKENFNYWLFGKYLLIELEKIYLENEMDIAKFGAKVYMIWNMLPERIHLEQPFWTMSYADDPLSWGDEQQTRELYENMFQFYKNN